MRILSIPNAITLFRILIMPFFVAALLYERYDYALALFAVAAISDALDGLVARITKQKTIIGAFLDPLADKCILVIAFILLSLQYWMPKWLTIIVVSRDLIIVIGWLLLYLGYHITKIEPSILGKITSASQFLIVAYLLLSINIQNIPPPGDWMFWAVAALTIVSGFQYVRRALRQLNEK
ncbi:CDP-alcohol phosphatidyltransferase family protein [Thermodesulfovibrionales bacterium]|nr:CDP-alcohol phosphatidyltransferase family protein [Thermodesulfovibrionales bacterium]MCL0034031.1 CDP-alcohol phosphatidyltransferase family protein [Thermodesulfovibrionales bacterium]MCL0062085.1 CDP-alcohol phosphatidyltransferase family protein [Thermodesulfovibrionales bacterium]MCL0086020.1 CDP-alcohol phosphatidyltransferase family protein [Thermodesulfovibrionales bacterium]